MPYSKKLLAIPNSLPSGKEFLERKALVDLALEEVPALLQEAGWSTFWEVLATIPIPDQPGFLATHRQHLQMTTLILQMEKEAFKDYPTPVNTPLGFVALSTFLRLANWMGWRKLRETAIQQLEESGGFTDLALLEMHQENRSLAQHQINHPKIMDAASTDLPDSLREEIGSFSNSVQVFLALANEGDKARDYVAIFEHPNFIWIERPGVELEAKAKGEQYGKWVISLRGVPEAIRVIKRLLPSFRTGEATCAKFLLHPTELGNIYILLYADDKNFNRRETLKAAAGADPFFVYDRDCHEAGSLKSLLEQLKTQCTSDDIRKAKHRIDNLRWLAEQEDFGASFGISSEQRNIILAVLKMTADANPNDRWNYLAVTYFNRWKATMATILPKCFLPENHLLVRLYLTLPRPNLGPEFLGWIANQMGH